MLADEKILFRKIFKRALLPSFTLHYGNYNDWSKWSPAQLARRERYGQISCAQDI